MKRILISLVLAMILLAAAQARAFTIYDRSSHTGPKGETVIFYTIVISGDEAKDLKGEMNKILGKVIYEIYPAEPDEIRNNLEFYCLQIVVKFGDKTKGYLEWPVHKTVIDQILEEDLKIDSI